MGGADDYQTAPFLTTSKELTPYICFLSKSDADVRLRCSDVQTIEPLCIGGAAGIGERKDAAGASLR